MILFFFFFFKQKTAYEMRISDWSSDVCSSDLQRAETLSWLMWQMGSAPFLGGGFGHFYAYAPFKQEYPINRYAMEVKRQLDVLDRRLADNEYVAGADYTVADMAIWPWYGLLAKGLAYDAGEFLQVQDYKHVQRWKIGRAHV